MTKRVKDIVWALFHPNHWISNYPSDEMVDEYINKIIDEDLIVDFDSYKARTKDGLRVWVGNYPHCYGSLYKTTDLLPYRRTRAKLKRYLDEKEQGKLESTIKQRLEQ